MAYGNWGAFVWKNGELKRDCYDTGFDIGDLHIGGHAVINCDDLIFEFYKAYFPTIYEKEAEGIYKKWDESEFIENYGINKLQFEINVNIKPLTDNKTELTLNDFYYSFKEDAIIDLEYKGYKICFQGNRFEIIPINTVEIITPKGDVWYCVYGMSFGSNGYEKQNISKCHNKYLKYDPEEKEYWYDCRNIYNKMKKAYGKDSRNHELYWVKYYIKDILKSIIILQFGNIPRQFRSVFEHIQKAFDIK